MNTTDTTESNRHVEQIVRIVGVIGITGSLLALIPFVWLNAYTHPQCDDWWFAVVAKREGIFGAQVWWYLNWLSRYTSSFVNTLLASMPMTGVAYKFIAPGLFVLLFASVWFAVHNALRGRIPKHHSAVFAVLFLLCWLCTLYSTSEAIYWFSSSITYQLGAVAGFTLAGVLFGGERKRAIELPSAFLLALAAMGCNEITAAWMLVLVLTGLIFKWRDRIYRTRWVAATCGMLLGAVLVLSAPGPRTRNEFNPEAGELWLTVRGASQQFLHDVPKWILSYAVLGLLLISLIYLWTHRDRFRIEVPTRKALIFLTLGWLALTWVLYVPNWWLLGWAAPWRVREHIHLVFLAGWMAILFMVSIRVMHSGRYGKLLDVLGKWRVPGVALAWLLLTIGLWTGDGTAWAIRDLEYRAPAYDRTLDARFAYIREAYQRGERDLVVPCIESPPYTLNYYDITPYTYGMYNRFCAEYFGLNSIRTDKAHDEP